MLIGFHFSKMFACLNTLSSFCNSWMLDINSKKTKVMIFQKPAKNYIRFAVEWENFTSKLLVKLFFLLRTSEAEFFTSLIFKRFLSNIWS